MERNCGNRRGNGLYGDMKTNNTELQQVQENAIKWTEMFLHKIHHKQNPTKEELEEVLNSLPPIDDDEPWQSEMENALKLKLNAKDEADTLVRTMTREQLFMLNNPLWTKDLSLSDVQYVLHSSQQDNEQGEKIEKRFPKLLSEF